MGANDLLARVWADGLSIEVQGDRLVVTGPADIRDRWRDSLRHAKPEILVAQSKAVEPTCAACRHRSKWGNCLQPVSAELVTTFGLIRHPAGGAGCRVFEPLDPEVDALEVWLARLLAINAIDQSDAALARLRHPEDPSAWDLLLTACEAAAAAR